MICRNLEIHTKPEYQSKAGIAAEKYAAEQFTKYPDLPSLPPSVIEAIISQAYLKGCIDTFEKVEKETQ